jgi:hypothetical protein
MRFQRHGDRRIGIEISGQGRNYLELRFGPPTVVYAWSPIHDRGERLRVNAGDVKRQVLAGVADANREAGSSLSVTRIWFLESDSPSESIYREMARRIALRHLAGDEEFDGVESSEP